MCYTPPLQPAGTDSCLLRDTSVPRMVLVQLPCHLQGQTVVFSGIHLSSKSCHAPPLDRQFALTGIHLSPRRRCTPPLPPAGTDECLLRDASVPKEGVHLPCYLRGQTAVLSGTNLSPQRVGKYLGADADDTSCCSSCCQSRTRIKTCNTAVPGAAMWQMPPDLSQVMYTLATSMQCVCQTQEEVKCKRLYMLSALPLLGVARTGSNRAGLFWDSF